MVRTPPTRRLPWSAIRTRPATPAPRTTKYHGQVFTIGSETTGYTVTSVTIRSEDPNDDPIPLQICEVDESTHPTADCWDLTGPSV